MAQPHMLAGQIPGRGRQVVGGHRRQAQIPPMFRLQRSSGEGVDFEPQDRGAQHAALTQIVPHPWLDGAEVLTHHHRAGPVGLQRHDSDHCVVVVAHIGALGGRDALRDPPQPEQSDDVVDPHPAGMAQNCRDESPKRLVAKLFEPIRSPRWLRPVLAQLVELIGRGARIHPERQHILQRPGVGAGGMHTDGKIMHDAQRHPGAQRL